MARPTKVGVDYFPLDCHMEEKIRLIQAEFGLKGFAVVVKLYQKIYGELGYYCEWNEDSLLLFMSENGVSSRDGKNLIEEIVRACIRRNIFSEELFNKYGVLTSVGVQKRYLESVSRRESVELKKEYLLISVPKNTVNVVINSINANINSINVCNNPQSKVNKTKENKSKAGNEPDGSAPKQKSKPEKHKYGEYNNVYLTDEEVKRLKEQISNYQEYIERLSAYIASKGDKYKSHYATIRIWYNRDLKKEEKNNAGNIRADKGTEKRYGNYI